MGNPVDEGEERLWEPEGWKAQQNMSDRTNLAEIIGAHTD